MLSIVIKMDCLQELPMIELLGVATSFTIDLLRYPKACEPELMAVHRHYLMTTPVALQRVLLMNFHQNHLA
jgi:hypothetical protein